MQTIVFNTDKGRLETVEIEFTPENTPTFESTTEDESIWRVTDYNEGLLITTGKRNYPVWIGYTSRKTIGYSHKRAKELLATMMEG